MPLAKIREWLPPVRNVGPPKSLTAVYFSQSGLAELSYAFAGTTQHFADIAQ
jgi:hypothetical protein